MIINRKDENRVIGNMVNKAGDFICKVEKVESDGTTGQGDIKIKISFMCLDLKDVQGERYTHSESFPLTGKASFLINNFEDAMKCPENYNTDDLIGRYVLASFTENKYLDKTGSEKVNFKPSKWEYSTKNDKLTPFKVASNEDDEEDIGDIF